MRKKYLSILEYIRTYIDRATEWIGRGTAWLTTVLVCVVTGDVVSRYLFKKSLVSVQELQWHIFAVIFLLGASYTLKHDKHVRVDVIYAKLNPNAQAAIDLLGTVVFLIPFSMLVVWSSQDFVMNSFQIREVSPDPGGLPARFLLKAVIPVSFVLLLLQSIALICQSLKVLLNDESMGGSAVPASE